ncbi:hypothetical protein RRG08_057712 [Elysia crispata]|uniref:SEA domain-containing protein n=1 Tax=Elysia crispata TaxID=231223 RepID=A0AAE0ZFN4_9GAST|nr:hypothetical protein RRG08_057712 [Elysia crispata]
MTASVASNVTQEHAIEADREVVFSLGLANKNFTLELNDSTSEEFIMLSKAVCDEVLGSLGTLSNETNCTVLEFREGSVYAIIQLTFPELDDNTPQAYSNIKSETLGLLNKAVQQGQIGKFKLKSQPVCALEREEIVATQIVCPSSSLVNSPNFSSSTSWASHSQAGPINSEIGSIFATVSATLPLETSAELNAASRSSNDLLPSKTSGSLASLTMSYGTHELASVAVSSTSGFITIPPMPSVSVTVSLAASGPASESSFLQSLPSNVMPMSDSLSSAFNPLISSSEISPLMTSASESRTFSVLAYDSATSLLMASQSAIPSTMGFESTTPPITNSEYGTFVVLASESATPLLMTNKSASPVTMPSVSATPLLMTTESANPITIAFESGSLSELVPTSATSFLMTSQSAIPPTRN